MKRVIISGIGAEIPEAVITNEELVASFNQWVDAENPGRLAAGQEPLAKSDCDFIVYASGVETRHVIEREGILDPQRMTPRIPPRGDDELSVEAEFGLKSARKALDHAGTGRLRHRHGDLRGIAPAAALSGAGDRNPEGAWRRAAPPST